MHQVCCRQKLDINSDAEDYSSPLRRVRVCVGVHAYMFIVSRCHQPPPDTQKDPPAVFTTSPPTTPNNPPPLPLLFLPHTHFLQLSPWQRHRAGAQPTVATLPLTLMSVGTQTPWTASNLRLHQGNPSPWQPAWSRPLLTHAWSSAAHGGLRPVQSSGWIRAPPLSNTCTRTHTLLFFFWQSMPAVNKGGQLRPPLGAARVPRVHCSGVI